MHQAVVTAVHENALLLLKVMRRDKGVLLPRNRSQVRTQRPGRDNFHFPALVVWDAVLTQDPLPHVAIENHDRTGSADEFGIGRIE